MSSEKQMSRRTAATVASAFVYCEVLSSKGDNLLAIAIGALTFFSIAIDGRGKV